MYGIGCWFDNQMHDFSKDMMYENLIRLWHKNIFHEATVTHFTQNNTNRQRPAPQIVQEIVQLGRIKHIYYR